MPETVPYPMTETVPNIAAVFRAMSIVREQGDSVVFDAARSQIDRDPVYRKVTNLGWLLRHSADVVDLYVSTRERSRFYGSPAWPENVSAILSVRLHGGKVYACTWADRSLLAEWLDRPSFQGRMISWDHRAMIVGGDDFRSIDHYPKARAA